MCFHSNEQHKDPDVERGSCERSERIYIQSRCLLDWREFPDFVLDTWPSSNKQAERSRKRGECTQRQLRFIYQTYAMGDNKKLTTCLGPIQYALTRQSEEHEKQKGKK